MGNNYQKESYLLTEDYVVQLNDVSGSLYGLRLHPLFAKVSISLCGPTWVLTFNYGHRARLMLCHCVVVTLPPGIEILPHCLNVAPLEETRR